MGIKITSSDMDAIALGGAFLGTGGGGDPYIGKLMARQALQEAGSATLVDVDSLPDDAFCVTVAMMGAPTVMVEKLPSGEEILKALSLFEDFAGRKADALICVEAGGLNSTIPFMVAAKTGLPLIDGDGMGRAFPELQMVSFTLHDIPACPLALTDEKGNSTLFTTISNDWTERLARAVTIQMGGAALLASYAMTGAQAKKAILRGTLNLIKNIGETILQSRSASMHPGPMLRRKLNGTHLFTGRVMDVERVTTGGFARGRMLLRGIDDFQGKELFVHFQNEFLVAETTDGEVLCSTPDLICALDADAGLPVTTEQMRYGLVVELTGLPADEQWRTPEGLKIVGPGYFGYDHAFVPLPASPFQNS